MASHRPLEGTGEVSQVRPGCLRRQRELQSESHCHQTKRHNSLKNPLRVPSVVPGTGGDSVHDGAGGKLAQVSGRDHPP